MSIIQRIQNIWGCFDFGAAWFELWYRENTFKLPMEKISAGLSEEMFVREHGWPPDEKKG